MAYQTLPYTIVNGDTSDANKVMENFQALLESTTDGTLDQHVNTMALESNSTHKLIATPAANPAVGYIKEYYDATGGKRWLNASGVSGRVGGGAVGGSPIFWDLVYSPAPVESSLQGMSILEFNETDTQGIYANFTVPSDYISGKQILLRGGQFAISGTSGNILFRTTAYLIKPETTELATFVNYHLSVNTQLTAATANLVRAIGDLDLTDATGFIDSLSVAVGDTILVLLKREIASETVAATFSARVLKQSFYPIFG